MTRLVSLAILLMLIGCGTNDAAMMTAPTRIALTRQPVLAAVTTPTRTPEPQPTVHPLPRVDFASLPTNQEVVRTGITSSASGMVDWRTDFWCDGRWERAFESDTPISQAQYEREIRVEHSWYDVQTQTIYAAAQYRIHAVSFACKGSNQ